MGSAEPHVHVFATGGTIQNPPDVEGYISGVELIRNVPGIDDEHRLSVTDISSLASNRVTPETWYALQEAITDACRGRDVPDGVVFTSGSNALEETAYFLNLTLSTDVPVVGTAAQRNHGTVGNDGDRNLLDSIRVAGDPDARGRGVLVVANDLIHQARDVTKLASGRPDAWQSGDLGALGLVDKYGHLQFYRRTERRHTVDSSFDLDGETHDEFPKVDVVYSAAGADGGHVTASIENGARGSSRRGSPPASRPTPSGPRASETPSNGR